MGRRSDHSREELREMILSTAEKLVRKNGISFLTARNIASEIGYAVGTLYNLFKNLDDLVLYINGRTLDSLYQQISKAKNIKALAKSYIQFAKDEPHLWGMLFDHTNKDRKNLPEWYKEKIDRMFNLTENILINEIDVNKKTLKKAAKVIWASIHGICVLSISGTLETTKSDSAHSLANSVIENYLKGISSR